MLFMALQKSLHTSFLTSLHLSFSSLFSVLSFATLFKVLPVASPLNAQKIKFKLPSIPMKLRVLNALEKLAK